MILRVPKPGRWRYAYLLIALVVLLLAYPYLGTGGPLGVAALLIPIAAVNALATHQRHRAVPMVLAIVTLAGIAQEAAGVEALPKLVPLGSALLLFAYTTVFVLVRVLRSERVTGDTLCGAIAVYLLIGLTWSVGYMLIEYLQPGSFRLVLEGTLQATDKDLLYFGYVTLATLGYGDVLPVTHAARSQAVLEGLCGIIYIAILVARLIGLHLAAHVSLRGDREAERGCGFLVRCLDDRDDVVLAERPVRAGPGDACAGAGPRCRRLCGFSMPRPVPVRR
jgi:hypothetical protein